MVQSVGLIKLGISITISYEVHLSSYRIQIYLWFQMFWLGITLDTVFRSGKNSNIQISTRKKLLEIISFVVG